MCLTGDWLAFPQNLHPAHKPAQTWEHPGIKSEVHSKRALALPAKCHESCMLLRDCCWYAGDTNYVSLACGRCGGTVPANHMPHKLWCYDCLTTHAEPCRA